jgi:bla regulator protein blaR1
MNTLFIYLIQSTISLSVFYFFFQVVFRHEAYFRFNRYYLLSAMLLSVLLPFANINMNQIIFGYSSLPLIEAPVHSLVEYTLSEVTIYAQKPETFVGIGALGLSVYGIIGIIYLVGVIISSLFFIMRLFQLSKLFKNTQSFVYDGSKIIFTKSGTPTFSFYKYIFISEDLFKQGKDIDKIIEHEKIHIRHKHTLDLLIAELFVIIQWFNPIVYFLKKTLKENHEFIADYDVVGQYSDVGSYSMLLIDHSNIISTNILTHNFSYSLLKRRLLMIRKTKNPFLFTFKLSWVLLALSIVFYACSGPTSEEIVAAVPANNEKIGENDVFSVVEEMPQYPGGTDELIAYLSSNIVYPEEAKNNNTQGKVIVNFVVNKHGEVTNVNVKKGIGSGCDEEAVRVVSNMPAWVPGKHKGKTVKVNYELPINFVFDNKVEDEVFVVVEDMPEFPGGTKELINYLSNNIKYPEEAKKNQVQGKVFVSFVVEKNGEVNNVSVLRGIGSGCDKEAVRVVEMMPKWEPGTQNDKPVRVKYNLPINFKLQ